MFSPTILEVQHLIRDEILYEPSWWSGDESLQEEIAPPKRQKRVPKQSAPAAAPNEDGILFKCAR